MGFEFNDNTVNELQSYYEENYYRPSYRMVSDIIRYVAAQGLDIEESTELLLVLLGSSGITEEEIKTILLSENE